MKLAVKILAFIPLGIELLLLATLPKEGWGNLEIPILIAILLTIIGGCIINNNKIIQRTGVGSLAILTVLFCIVGYYDYIPGFSLGIGVVTFIYFIFIKIAYKDIVNTTSKNEESYSSER
ncbi:MAG: hypothetical protein E7E64_06780 [Clostridium celatum]|uniref:hypothetical protein n=1 Tax=Clostridium sp. TaxID=1506 RepID=UPI0025C5BB23|nr:hypothetical protein [Clostridium sp.]MBS4956255.1 hypothetical protein [Clostridium sp.]MBS6183736.1 hypothetical protein [Clostridium celatum]MDU2122226.1 hypothetical protein [Clostridium celatum]MDU4978167.1 hypothetical protein [Clostridium celatum]